MMNVLKGKTAPAREKRLKTLSAYLGGAQALLQELGQESVKQRIRTFTQAAEDDVLHVLRLIQQINDAAVVIHGPRGCSAGQLYFGMAGEQKRWSVTNLDEKDTIMGGEASLREAIVTLYHRHHPPVIFVVTTPVVAINNDDVFSVIEELKEELPVMIVPVYADGFKSRTAVTGYDAALHALLKYVPFNKGPAEKAFVNLLSIAENEQDIGELERLIHALGLATNVLPHSARLHNFAAAPQAKASISLNDDECDYLGRVLEENYKVKFIHPSPPVGINGTRQWLAALARAAGLEKKADEIHAQEYDRLKPLLERPDCRNSKVYVNLPAAAAFAVSGLLTELGASVIGLTVDHIDELHRAALAEIAERQPELSIHVAQGQSFEQANILRRLEPHVYIGRAADAVWAAKCGVAAIAVEQLPIMGYRGVAAVFRQLRKALLNRSFAENLKNNATLPYQKSWYAKSSNWHIKLEVK